MTQPLIEPKNCLIPSQQMAQSERRRRTGKGIKPMPYLARYQHTDFCNVLWVFGNAVSSGDIEALFAFPTPTGLPLLGPPKISPLVSDTVFECQEHFYLIHYRQGHGLYIWQVSVLANGTLLASFVEEEALEGYKFTLCRASGYPVSGVVWRGHCHEDESLITIPVFLEDLPLFYDNTENLRYTELNIGDTFVRKDKKYIVKRGNPDLYIEDFEKALSR